MSYCLNPNCQQVNEINAKFCHKCGISLLLLERYRGLKVIGQGGFGKTYLAQDEARPSKPKCVIKQFTYSGQGMQKASELFQQEAVQLDELGKHPQIPELFAHGDRNGQQFLVQEFIDGQNLAQELTEQGTFTETKIRELLLPSQHKNTAILRVKKCVLTFAIFAQSSLNTLHREEKIEFAQYLH